MPFSNVKMNNKIRYETKSCWEKHKSCIKALCQLPRGEVRWYNFKFVLEHRFVSIVQLRDNNVSLETRVSFFCCSLTRQSCTSHLYELFFFLLIVQESFSLLSFLDFPLSPFFYPFQLKTFISFVVKLWAETRKKTLTSIINQ